MPVVLSGDYFLNIKQLILVTMKCGDFFTVRTEFLGNI
jgi:hypothetical protein